MIQNLPNELQIGILNYVITESNFQYFCTLRTVCKKWNAFVPLLMHNAVISELNSGLKLAFTYWSDLKIKKLSPTYNDYTKTFTFQFDNNHISRPFSDNKINFVAFIQKSGKDVPFMFKLGAVLGVLTFPKFLNDDIYKHEFDHRNEICFFVDKGESISHVKLHSFTIEAWKLYYILDCLKFDTKISYLKKGFRYATWADL
ncbi:30772_t:CDS:2 [Gigaspora margarita]|uniref:30772_t:CDS:1 n=1 Tax=Gigaspora margarita TaxID=4874 RepID=A0ABN7V3Z2_GIGMA|nr:30772_t:CDS:2 [Gigaspora margarita]